MESVPWRPQAVCPGAGSSPSLDLTICICEAQGAFVAARTPEDSLPASLLHPHTPTPCGVDGAPPKWRKPAGWRTLQTFPAPAFGVLFTVGFVLLPS